MSQEPTSPLMELIRRQRLEEQNLRRISEQAFQELRQATATDDDEALLRCCATLDQYAVVESTRRLRQK